MPSLGGRPNRFTGVIASGGSSVLVVVDRDVVFGWVADGMVGMMIGVTDRPWESVR